MSAQILLVVDMAGGIGLVQPSVPSTFNFSKNKQK